MSTAISDGMQSDAVPGQTRARLLGWLLALAAPWLASPAVATEAKSAASTLTCWYATRDGGIDAHPDCASLQGGQLRIGATHLRRMAFDRHGLATLAVESRHYYVRRVGRTLPVVAWDNWVDDYAEGLVRSQRDSKIGFYDRRFRQVIAPRYDWAWPFDGGKAVACIGCTPDQTDEEHRTRGGGRWFYIDRQGRELGPAPQP